MGGVGVVGCKKPTWGTFSLRIAPPKNCNNSIGDLGISSSTFVLRRYLRSKSFFILIGSFQEATIYIYLYLYYLVFELAVLEGMKPLESTLLRGFFSEH